MANNTINITIVGGKLHYELVTTQGRHTLHTDGKEAHVHVNDKIKWHCDAGDYAILFKRSALDLGVLSANAGQDTKKANVTAAYDPTPGADNTYPYFVIVVTQPLGIPIYEDPDIIIDT